MAFDEIKAGEANLIRLEVSSRVRFLVPSPSAANCAKALLVYRSIDDGAAKKTSSQIAYPGSPVLIMPEYVYIARSDIARGLTVDAAAADIDPIDRIPIIALVSDDVRMVFGGENHLFYTVTDTGRLPQDANDTRTCVRFPNPGARRIGFWMRGSAGLTAEVIARGIPPSTNQQTVIGPLHPTGVHTTGTADIVPIDWEVRLTSNGTVPTSVDFYMSFNEEA